MQNKIQDLYQNKILTNTRDIAGFIRANWPDTTKVKIREIDLGRTKSILVNVKRKTEIVQMEFSIEEKMPRDSE